MPFAPITASEIHTLPSFYSLVSRTGDVRRAVVAEVLEGRAPPRGALESLENALASLRTAPGTGVDRSLALDATRRIEVDLTYEMRELEKDVLYLREGEEALLAFLAELHPDFEAQVREGVARLGRRSYRAFVTDRDGTVNNYCGRYRSSVQAAYNAVLLARFARACTESPIIVTSGPLADPGVLDVSVLPPGTMIYAASKGREFVDLEGRRHDYPIAAKQKRLLDSLNARLRALVREPAYERFGLIGSGLQHKFGQTTIARQDITGSICAEDSTAFLRRLEAIVAELDPAGEALRIEDTGLDVEIILTIDEAAGAARDFDKGDAVRLLEAQLGLHLERGPHLVCGDTSSDVPMLEATLERCAETWGVFVTRREELAARVTALTPHALVVEEPDILIAILGALASLPH